jgi:hypothetical protein
MAPPNKPVIGNLYDMERQHKMHGGAHQHCAPTKDGDVTLLRLTPEHNPDAPYIVDWELSNNPKKVRQIQEQTQQKPLPVYVRRRANGWEYMGQFRVAHVATDRPTLPSERRELDTPSATRSIWKGVDLSDGPARVGPATAGPQESAQRPWWRVFGEGG